MHTFWLQIHLGTGVSRSKTTGRKGKVILKGNKGH